MSVTPLNPKKKNDLLALVLSGGGARGAYQAGVLKYIGENIKEANIDILVGSSSGAINAAGVASCAGSLEKAGALLSELWGGLRMNQVVRVDLWAIIKIAARWMYDLAFGGLTGHTRAQSLLDTAPLKTLLTNVMDLKAIDECLQSEKLKAFAVTATEVYTGSAVTFVQAKEYKNWVRARRRSEAAIIKPEHIMASAAIPFIFPSEVVGYKRYVDGCIRSTAPLGPAARLGASRILVVGVRRQVKRIENELKESDESHPEPAPSAARIASLVLNSLFSESLDADVEHLERLNQVVDKAGTHDIGIKKIETLVIRPSEDLGKLATIYQREFPFVVKYLLRGLGTKQGGAGDILSHLLFVPGYTRKLIELGYKDAANLDRELREFFLSSVEARRRAGQGSSS